MNKHDPLTWETHGATTQWSVFCSPDMDGMSTSPLFWNVATSKKLFYSCQCTIQRLIQIFFLSSSYTASNNCTTYAFLVVSLSPSWYFSQTALRVNTSDNFQHVFTRRRSTLASTAMGNTPSYSKLQMPCDHCRCTCKVPWNSKTTLPTRTTAHYFIHETATTPLPHHPLSPRTAKTLRSIVPPLVETSWTNTHPLSRSGWGAQIIQLGGLDCYERVGNGKKVLRNVCVPKKEITDSPNRLLISGHS